MKHKGLAGKNSKSSDSFRKARTRAAREAVAFALYVAEDQGDLRRATVYRLIPDEDSRKEGLLRVVDDSGEDYLYPEEFFVPLPLPPSVAARLVKLENRSRS